MVLGLVHLLCCLALCRVMSPVVAVSQASKRQIVYMEHSVDEECVCNGPDNDLVLVCAGQRPCIDNGTPLCACVHVAQRLLLLSAAVPELG